jgi:predicted transcriptional regulator
MPQQTQQLFQDVVDAKNHNSRNFTQLTNNFYLVKSALRYYTVEKEMSFTSGKISDSFPIPLNAVGSSLKVLEELDVIESRTESSHQNRYMPQQVNLDKIEDIEEILRENKEIEDFC